MGEKQRVACDTSSIRYISRLDDRFRSHRFSYNSIVYSVINETTYNILNTEMFEISYSCFHATISGDFVRHLLGWITFIARKYLQGGIVRRSRRETHGRFH